MPHHRRVLSRLAALIVTLLAGLGLAAPATSASTLLRDGASPPTNLNVIVVVVDDMNDFKCSQVHDYLPLTATWFADQGTCYENATVTDPVCCPARAELMSGQLPHNNRVNKQVDADNLDIRTTLQYRLGQAGYATYGVGKFLNGVEARRYYTGNFKTGFKQFQFWQDYDYLHYHLYHADGTAYLPKPVVHTTVRTGEDLRHFIAAKDAAGKTFYGYAAFYAPHNQPGPQNGVGKPPTPTAEHAHTAVPAFHYQPEANLKDKLPPFQHGFETKKSLTFLDASRKRALLDVDTQLSSTFALLAHDGVLDHTAVFLVSDNGYSLGQNGWTGKATPYPASIDVPVLAYLPPSVGALARPGTVDTRPVDLVDVAPTIYQLTGVTPGHELDGHSLLGTHVRADTFHEFTNERSRFVLSESGQSPFRVPTWSSYTKDGATYIEWTDQKHNILATEFYAADDPGFRRNLLWSGDPGPAPDPALITTMRDRLHQLQTCHGTSDSGSGNPCP